MEHIAEHGVSAEEAEFVMENAGRGFPRSEGNGKYRVWGQSESGEYLQVVFIIDADGTIFVIHARPLSDKEKRTFRRGR